METIQMTEITDHLQHCAYYFPLIDNNSYSVFIDAKREIEQLRTRVAELEAKAMQVGIDYSQAHILRKQAEAAEEAIVFALRTVGNVDPFEVNMHKFANDYAQRLRQQADDIEKGGD